MQTVPVPPLGANDVSAVRIMGNSDASAAPNTTDSGDATADGSGDAIASLATLRVANIPGPGTFTV